MAATEPELTCKGASKRKLRLIHFCVLFSFTFTELHHLPAAADGQEMTHYEEQ